MPTLERQTKLTNFKFPDIRTKNQKEKTQAKIKIKAHANFLTEGTLLWQTENSPNYQIDISNILPDRIRRMITFKLQQNIRAELEFKFFLYDRASKLLFVSTENIK